MSPILIGRAPPEVLKNAAERLTRTGAFHVAFFWILANLGI
jgi:hypothetical protein